MRRKPNRNASRKSIKRTSKQREEAERASNERIVRDSEERLSALSNAFENSLPTGVDTAYENIQQATVAHYETLKNLARERITDEGRPQR